MSYFLKLFAFLELSLIWGFPQKEMPKFISDVRNGSIVVVSSTAKTMVNGDFYCNGLKDHLFIQQALNMMNLTQGGRVILSDGIFNIDGQITMFSNISIIGQGINNTIIQLIEGAGIFELGLAVKGTIRGRGISNITIWNLTINGNKQRNNFTGVNLYGKHGFHCEMCSSVFIKSVEITNFPGHGFSLFGKLAEYNYSEKVNIEKSVSSNNGLSGFSIAKTITSLLANNYAVNNGLHG